MFDLICNMHSFDHKTALIIIGPEKVVVVGGGGAEANLLTFPPPPPSTLSILQFHSVHYLENSDEMCPADHIIVELPIQV